ncbi:MAG: amidohydrolase family protein [Chloroflexota bacterium]
MTTIQLPGLIDAHVHFREPGYTQKEDLYTGTAAALAGGVTMVLDMPNTVPATSTPERLQEKIALAATQTICDIGLFVGSTTTEMDAYLPAAQRACGLKVYVNETFGNLRIDDVGHMHRFFRTWGERANEVGYRMTGAVNGLGPVAVHAEEMAVAVCLNLSHLYNVPLHIVHVSRRSEIELIRAAKERGYPVTCEVTPHHLFLTGEDAKRLGTRGDMRPKLVTQDDVDALWENLAYVDIFATDHAPHTLQEKGIGMSTPPESTPPGVPGVETMLPLLLTAVHEDRLTMDDILQRCVEHPQRVYGLPAQEDTHIEVDVDAVYTLTDADMHTKCGWTPFAGTEVRGRVERVVLRGETVFEHGQVLAQPGSGRVLFR